MATTNLFAKAKTTGGTKKTNKKDEKIRVSVQDPGFFNNIKMLEALNENMKRDKAKADMISDEIRDLGKSEWAKVYGNMGRNPGSIMLEAKDGDDISQVMFIAQDKYISINEERAGELKEKYEDGIVEEKTTFSFDNTMIEKYGEILSRLIEESEDIADEDKDKIIKATTEFSVAKGTIDKMKDYGNVLEVMESVRPVVALKSPEVIKG